MTCCKWCKAPLIVVRNDVTWCIICDTVPPVPVIPGRT